MAAFGWWLPSDPPCREAMGRGTVAAGDGGGRRPRAIAPPSALRAATSPWLRHREDWNGNSQPQNRHPQRARNLSPQPRRLNRRQRARDARVRSEEHTSELQSLMRISYAVFCLNKKNI